MMLSLSRSELGEFAFRVLETYGPNAWFVVVLEAAAEPLAVDLTAEIATLGDEAPRVSVVRTGADLEALASERRLAECAHEGDAGPAAPLGGWRSCIAYSTAAELHDQLGRVLRRAILDEALVNGVDDVGQLLRLTAADRASDPHVFALIGGPKDFRRVAAPQPRRALHPR